MSTAAPDAVPPVEASASNEKSEASWLWLPVAALLAILLWVVIASPVQDDRPEQALEPFAKIDVDLIQGEGLGPGAADLPSWPADFGTSPVGQVGQVGAFVPGTARNANAGGFGARSAEPTARIPASAGDVTPNSFRALDRNSDGRLSPAEFAIYRLDGVRPNHKGNKADDMAPYVPTHALNRTIGEFRRLDRNNDWFVSPAEFNSSG